MRTGTPSVLMELGQTTMPMLLAEKPDILLRVIGFFIYDFAQFNFFVCCEIRTCCVLWGMHAWVYRGGVGDLLLV